MAWAFVSGASTSTATVTKSVTAGNLLVVGHAIGDGTSSPTISDGVNTWTAVSASPVHDVGGGAGVAMWWAVAATTASITVTISGSSASFIGTWIAEYSGNAAANLADGSAGTASIAGSTATDGQATGSFTPTTDGCLILSFINDDGGDFTVNQYTAGTGFTERPTAAKDPAGSGETTYSVEDKVQTTAAAINPTWTEIVSSLGVGIGAAFKVASAAPPPLDWSPVVRTIKGQPVGVVASGFTPGSVTGS